MIPGSWTSTFAIQPGKTEEDPRKPRRLHTVRVIKNADGRKKMGVVWAGGWGDNYRTPAPIKDQGFRLV